MRLLVLGGGGFLGWHLVAEAQAAGHDVTTFSREPTGHDDVETLLGDRTGDLSALEEQVRDGVRWDAVVDTFSTPDAVRRTASLLSTAAEAYGYVSGMSVYAPDGSAVPDEEAPVRREGAYDDRLQERSVAKLACESVVREELEGAVLVPRVGIMVGPRDPTDRFTYWPARLARALDGSRDRRVLVPGDPDRPVQLSDARDLAGWVVESLRLQREGVFNVVGPGRHESLTDVLDACRRAADVGPDDVRLVPLRDEDRLRDVLAHVDDEERPLWFPEDQIPQDAVDSSKAVEAGLTFRPVEETARDTLMWRRDQGPLTDLLAGLPPDLEARLLDEVTPAADGRPGQPSDAGSTRATTSPPATCVPTAAT